MVYARGEPNVEHRNAESLADKTSLWSTEARPGPTRASTAARRATQRTAIRRATRGTTSLPVARYRTSQQRAAPSTAVTTPRRRAAPRGAATAPRDIPQRATPRNIERAHRSMFRKRLAYA